jgi:hypothetical protein
VIYACWRLAPLRGERHQLPPTFPRLPGIIPAALPAVFSCRRAAPESLFSSGGCSDAHPLRDPRSSPSQSFRRSDPAGFSCRLHWLPGYAHGTLQAPASQRTEASFRPFQPTRGPCLGSSPPANHLSASRLAVRTLLPSVDDSPHTSLSTGLLGSRISVGNR